MLVCLATKPCKLAFRRLFADLSHTYQVIIAHFSLQLTPRPSIFPPLLSAPSKFGARGSQHCNSQHSKRSRHNELVTGPVDPVPSGILAAAWPASAFCCLHAAPSSLRPAPPSFQLKPLANPSLTLPSVFPRQPPGSCCTEHYCSTFNLISTSI